MKNSRHDVVASLPQLLQFAVIVTGTDDLADEAVMEALRRARNRLDEAASFPSSLSWLLSILHEVLQEHRAGETCSFDLSLGLSILEIPAPERIALVLVDGFKLDIDLAALVCAEPGNVIKGRLLRGRGMLGRLPQPMSFAPLVWDMSE